MSFFAPVFAEFDPLSLIFAAAAMFVAGIIKGAVGFALPTVAISGIASIMPATVAIAGIMLPALLTNFWQGLRNGPRAAVASIVKFGWFILGIVGIMVLVAPLVAILPADALFLVLGFGITVFAVIQLAGWRPSEQFAARPRAAVAAAVTAGVFGGLAGATGPAVVFYLLARGLKKVEQVRVQGLIFSLGLAAISLVHGATGVLDRLTLPLSVLLVVPAIAGMTVGLFIQDRLDQETFRRATLIVLVVAGLNLLRRGLIG
ncbi:sulfite exporter TauE/SafE family protein [Pontivivens insulae]|uniref:Probable membrane transporter protein n=1 Tax=Pontivivens insulae TaxID=1639689 RepID=A0A2R8ADV0_9RHOB|nr:sulfite exporter TauE/SafE family protein [Pontivivens insulae]RED14165.1 hypothetical protein DFR53_1521 [Pontivivens insulae]SPF30240.1 hypothetical protein POI8812_02576 [Pontivivens insulae]